MARTLSIAGAIVALLLLGSAAMAADPSEADQLREQLRATVLQLRQLQDQQAAAAQPAATPPPDDAKKLASALARLRAAQRDAARAAQLQTALDKAHADNATLTATAAAKDAEMQKLNASLNQSETTDHDLTVERDALKAKLARMTNVATACQAKNDRLTAFGESMLAAYRKLTFGEAILAREPLLGLKRVELETIAQEREDTVRDNHCDPRLDAAPPGKRTSG